MRRSRRLARAAVPAAAWSISRSNVRVPQRVQPQLLAPAVPYQPQQRVGDGLAHPDVHHHEGQPFAGQVRHQRGGGVVQQVRGGVGQQRRDGRERDRRRGPGRGRPRGVLRAEPRDGLAGQAGLAHARGRADQYRVHVAGGERGPEQGELLLTSFERPHPDRPPPP